MILTAERRAYSLQKQLHYQNLVDVRGGPTGSVEALLRLYDRQGVVHHPDRYLRRLRHDRFRMRRLTTWAIFQAFNDLRLGREAGARIDNVAVNVATEDLCPDYIVTAVECASDVSGIPPLCLTIEISENTVVDDMNRVRQASERLRELGVGIAIDDFGAGCSVLRYLSEIPATAVKFDRCFLDRAPSCALTRKVLGGAIDLVHSLGMKAVVEGVENEVQRDIAVWAGADELQGYLFGRPAAIATVLAA